MVGAPLNIVAIHCAVQKVSMIIDALISIDY